MNAQRARLAGDRWHFGHGPIDLVIGADGEARSVEAAHEAAWRRFEGVLSELVVELSVLRRPVSGSDCPLQGPIAARMWRACHPYRQRFITPMAAVAGAVAEEIVAFYRRPGVERAWVNNGGDIALHLEPGGSLRIGLFADVGRLAGSNPAGPSLARSQRAGGQGAGPGRVDRQLPAMNGLDGRFEIQHAMPVRGIATSGWRGRSFSLGIADSVTVLAQTAAQADAAATIVANAVDVDDPRIVRRPANELKDDTDLGALPVTVEVPALGEQAVQAALAAGECRARELRNAGLVYATVLVCQGLARIVGPADIGLPEAARAAALH